jgi:putative protease
MPYELIADGKPVDLGQRRYLLSPQDLAGLEVLPDLIDCGVASLKIEGRLKSPEYVAAVTRTYRQALDRIGTQLGLSRFKPMTAPEADKNGAATEAVHDTRSFAASPEDKYELEMAFSRGLSTGWFRGIDNQRLVHARFGKKRGVFLGDIEGTRGESLLLRLQGPLKAGDGVVIDSGIGDDHEQGGRVISIHERDGVAQLCFRPGQIQPRRVRRGDKVWKTDDPDLNRRVRQTYEGTEPKALRPIRMEIHGRPGECLTLIARDELGHVVQTVSQLKLVEAKKHALNESALRAQLGRLGGTVFQLQDLTNRLEGDLMLPVSELNRVRRQAIHALTLLRERPKRWTIHSPTSPASLISAAFGKGVSAAAQLDADQPFQLIVLARSIEQMEASVRQGVRTVYCDFEDPKRYRDAVKRFREMGSGGEIWAAPPRVFKPGEDWILKIVRSCEADGYLVRNPDHIAYFQD